MSSEENKIGRRDMVIRAKLTKLCISSRTSNGRTSQVLLRRVIEANMNRRSNNNANNTSSNDHNGKLYLYLYKFSIRIKPLTSKV